MLAAWKTLQQSFKIWWRELSPFVLLNVAWILLQIPLITAPAATAALVSAARQAVYEGEVDYAEFWRAFRRYFRPALGWLLVNLLFIGLLLANFWLAQTQSGAAWWALRFFWLFAAWLWIGLNLFYWPIYLAQESPSASQTWRIATRLLLNQPVFVLSLVLLALALTVFSILLTVLVSAALGAWLALLGVCGLQFELQRSRGD